MPTIDTGAATPTEATASKRRSRSRKIRAVLAGGLVLGIGAAITLAAWTDNEYATGTFTAGTFNMQGSTTSATTGFSDHTSAAGAAALTFTAPFNNLSPGQVVYSPFWVRLAANTTSAATLDLVALTSTDTAPGTNSANLSYTVYAIGATAACDATVTSGTPVVMGTATTLAPNANVAGATPNLPNGSPVTAAGTATQLCFVVTAGSGLTQGGSTTATWQFTATSTI
ncbi:SipW-dependent-type signal peptide-containing protein [Agrococcus jejuensis]|uniref:SipW-cognate class signal peptide n=1 Tax=Agrococcus jejuensis TaxID=399736 RepID=A0A1G8B3L4_9MICO|nr:SipW-dependent-type signal peptide-containing protein [Agrococcus jejuensis]SDH27725.1 SipW-cognate class signal peptide [Agrococcus jejuensis]